jgi:uncharacterized protein (DUF2147 family)
MKRKLFAVATAAATLLATATLADPVHGTWKTIADDNGNYGLIQIEACGSAICGTLVKSFDGSGAALDSPNNGRKIIWDMQPQGGGAYGKGKVYSPDRDKTYNSKMTLSGDKLAIEGCVLGICRDGGTWTRVN